MLKYLRGAFDNTLTTIGSLQADGEISQDLLLSCGYVTDTHKELLFKKAGNYIVTVEIKQGSN